MKETARKFLHKGEQSVAAAEHLLLDGYPEFAASRADYTVPDIYLRGDCGRPVGTKRQ